jgi:hypothetical protein
MGALRLRASVYREQKRGDLDAGLDMLPFRKDSWNGLSIEGYKIEKRTVTVTCN